MMKDAKIVAGTMLAVMITQGVPALAEDPFAALYGPPPDLQPQIVTSQGESVFFSSVEVRLDLYGDTGRPMVLIELREPRFLFWISQVTASWTKDVLPLNDADLAGEHTLCFTEREGDVYRIGVILPPESFPMDREQEIRFTAGWDSVTVHIWIRRSGDEWFFYESPYYVIR